jgi:hypothetical protein
MQPTPRSSRAPRVSNREQLSLRRRRNAKRLGGATLVALFAAWFMLRAEPAAPLQNAGAWLEELIDTANTVAKSRVATAPVGAQRASGVESARFRPQAPGTDERARARADLRGPEAGTRVDTIAAEPARERTTVAAAAPRPSAAPAPAPAQPAPPSEAPIEPAPSEPSAPAAPGPDVIGDLLPSDFETSLGASADLGAVAANVSGGVDVDADEGSVAVATAASIATPVVPVEVGTQIGVNPGGADLAVNAAAGSLPVSTQVAIRPRETVAAVNLPIGGIETVAGDNPRLIADLDPAGIPIVIGADGDGLRADLPGLDLNVPVGDLLGGLLGR